MSRRKEPDPKDFVRKLMQSAITAAMYSLFRKLPRTVLIAILAALIGAAFLFKLY